MSTDTPTAPPTLTELGKMTPTERYNAQARALGAPEHKPVVTNGPPQFEFAHEPGTPEAKAATANLTRTVEAANATYAAKVAEVNKAYETGSRSESAKQVRDKTLTELRVTWQASLKSAYAGISKESAPPSTTSKTPPSPEDLEAQNRRVAEFDKEMRAQGLQVEPAPEPVNVAAILATLPTLPADQVDQRALSTLNQLWAKMEPPERIAKRATYENDIASIMAGRNPFTESMGAFIARKTAQPLNPTEAKPAEPAKPTGEPITPGSYQQHVVDGYVDIGKLSLVDTSGYSIPRYVADQTIDVGALEMLKAAKAAGITESQVHAVMRADAIKNGWVKA